MNSSSPPSIRTVLRIVGTYKVTGMTLLSYARVPLEVDADLLLHIDRLEREVKTLQMTLQICQEKGTKLVEALRLEMQGKVPSPP